MEHVRPFNRQAWIRTNMVERELYFVKFSSSCINFAILVAS